MVNSINSQQYGDLPIVQNTSKKPPSADEIFKKLTADLG